MPLSDEGWTLAHTLGAQGMTDDEIAEFMVGVMVQTADANGGKFAPKPSLLVAMAATRFAIRKIVTSEWQTYAAKPVSASDLIARILAKIDNNPNPLDDMPVVDRRPLPLKRLDDLEKRVEALETAQKKRSFGPKGNVELHVKIFHSIERGGWMIGIYNHHDVFVRQVIPEGMVTGIFNGKEFAVEAAKKYANREGFEYRDA